MKFKTKNMSKTHIILLLTLSAFMQIAQAVADTLPVSEDDYMGDVPQVLTVSRLMQPLSDAPSAVTVIDREMIRAAGVLDLAEIFRLVPGMYVGINAGFIHNTNHAVSYHGMTNSYPGSMQVLINGRSVYSPLYGGVQWSELPIALSDIERIEVTRGPNAASYGANSFFGVINIITQHPSDAPNNSIRITHGTGRNEAYYRHAGTLQDLNYRITIGHRDDNGLDNRNDFKRTQFLNAQGDYRVDDRNKIELEFGLMDGDREEGEITKDSLLFLPREKDINSNYQLIRWRHNVSDDSDFSLQAYHSFERSDDQTTSVNLRPLVAPAVLRELLRGNPNPTPQQINAARIIAISARNRLASNTITIFNPVESERWDIEAQHTFALSKTLRMVWGGSLRRDGTYAPHYLGKDETDYFDLQRLFSHVEWRPAEKWVVNAGAMVEHNDFTGTDISPRASLNFKPSSNHALRIGISKALRTPSYAEEKFNRSFILPVTSGQPILFQFSADKGDLQPEQIISREIGYLGKVGTLSIDARLFRDDITNVISQTNRINDFVFPAGVIAVSNGRIANGINMGAAATEGFETQLNWRIADSTNILLNYSHVNIWQTQAGLDVDVPLSMPKNSWSALVTQKFANQWDASLAYYQVGTVTALADGDVESLNRRVDARVAHKFNLGPRNAEVSVVVENLFDSHYQEFADYNTMRRISWVNFSIDF